MRTLKNIILVLGTTIAIAAIIINFDLIKEKIKNNNNSSKGVELIIREPNAYAKDYDFIYVSQLSNYEPHNSNDIKNIFYSVLNQGWDEFIFYCPETYETCIDDVKLLSNNEDILSYINNFVHPYNSYASIKTTYSDKGKVIINVNHLYKPEEINKIDKDINDILKNIINDNQTTTEKIKAIHDYVIDNTKYDSEKADTGSSKYDSSRIQGVLYDKHAICSGYADIASVMLSKLGIKNFRVASKNHIWNAVYVDGTWLNLDLTWDDPVSNSGVDARIEDYFLITTEQVKELDKKQQDEEKRNEHKYESNVYQELGAY